MKVTFYTIKKPIHEKLRVALVSDLHGRDHDTLLDSLSECNPNIIAVTGDLMELRSYSDALCRDNFKKAVRFLKKCSSICHVYYSLGNHESEITRYHIHRISMNGAVVLNNSFINFRGASIGGLTSGYVKNSGSTRATCIPDTKWLESFCSSPKFKILMCHHPEYYKDYLKDMPIDLILSGHAHGGQWRFFGRGVFAPGQGLFPRYTSGVYDERLVISRGLSNTGGIIPRIFNPIELVIVDVIPIGFRK